MATHSDKSPVTRETSAYVRDGSKLRAVMATIQGGCLIVRPKGTRREEVLDLAWCWRRGVEMRVFREKAEKRAARRGGRK